MKRIPFLSLILTFLFLGGLLLGVGLWYPDWVEATLLGLAMLALLTAQIIIVRRHLFGLPAGRTEWAMPAAPTDRPPAPEADATRAATESVSSSPATESPTPSTSDLPGKDSTGGEESTGTAVKSSAANPSALNIDSTVFSKFRAHLEDIEQSGEPAPRRTAGNLSGRGSNKAGVQSVSDEDGEVVARVQISSQNQNAAAPSGSTRPKKKADAPSPSSLLPHEESEGPDLFADLRPEPLPTPSRQPPDSLKDGEHHTGPTQATGETSPQGAAEASPQGAGNADQDLTKDGAPEVPSEGTSSNSPQGEATTSPTDPTSLEDAGSKKEVVEGPSGAEDHPSLASGPAREPETDEAGAAARGSKPSETEDEAAALLHMAEEAAGREDWDGARAGLENYLAHLADTPRLIQGGAYHLQVRLAVRDEDNNRALQGFEGLLKAGARPTIDSTPALLDTLLASADPERAHALRVSMLVRILALFRQQRDQRAMDIAYGWIEEAQSKVGDERRLIQYLRNHLEIRKALDDVPGQLELIDQLGNRCFQLGLTEEAQTYYKLGLKLRGGEESSEDGEPAN